MRKAIAYIHGPVRVFELGKAFVTGCKVHGVPCELRRADQFQGPEAADVVWHYGLGPALPVYQAYAGRAVRVIGDVGYWRELMPKLPQEKRYARISIEAAQLGPLMNKRGHATDRFRALNLRQEPVQKRGDYILVTGRSEYDAKVNGMAYGEWERSVVEKLRTLTSRPIRIREKPKNPLINIPGVARCGDSDCAAAIRGAWAVVCRSGNIGADAILHGVPVWAESGPGAVYRDFELDDIERAQPLSGPMRMAALADIAYWQYSTTEIAQGALWAHLRDEALV